ncbi:uncharacterized protein JCM6883_002306 [Sporobolomyces salmoneus]|uniref:uncharacterized protein n=1 Tax=Sporobolomyces salmoneus TaxID=183962 RepID=UPI0031776F23
MPSERDGSDFRLGRLRFIRLPPTSISFSLEKTKTDSVAFDIGVGITDDYGTDIDLFESINLRLEVVTGSQEETLGLKLASDDSKTPTHSSSIDFTFTPARGPFHGLSVKLTTLSSKAPLPKEVRFRLSVTPTEAPDLSLESTASKHIRELVGEQSQARLETWNDHRYILLSVESGEMELVRRSTTNNSSEKVQTTLRRITMPSSAPITIVERPGLNNSTGQRLWDCAIGLSAYFSLESDSFFASDPTLDKSETSSSQDDPSPPKKRRKTSTRTRIVELGAGCALASFTAVQTIQKVDDRSSVVATDVEATVETTLQENLKYNESVSKVKKQVLNWGVLLEAEVKEVLGPDTLTPTDLILIATDVLYNPESHSLLLGTLLSFLRPSPTITPLLSDTSSRALIAYKRRTEGDDGFFELARKAGLKVEKVWEWSEVSVWSFV